MKERPILFSGEMVRAILEGKKTQTRRIMKIQLLKKGWDTCKCPYGDVGDRLWVREGWVETDLPDGTPVVAYRAGGCIPVGRKNNTDYLIHEWQVPDAPEPGCWCPSIYMPRWASRITLEITGVRSERLQDINQADAVKEGIPRQPDWRSDEVERFRKLWESINGDISWAENPWVWVIEFKRVEPTT